MTVYERIRALRKAQGMSQDELAKKVGYEGRSAISKVENGDRDVSQSMLLKYAEALGVAPSYLLTGEETSDAPVSAYADLPDHPDIFSVRTKRVPLLGSIACGEPIFANEEQGAYILTSDDLDADFCLRARGDSMSGARILDGDIVFIRQQAEVENGQIAAVLIGDEATLKRVYYYPEKSKLILLPENPAYEPLVYVGAELTEVRILGRAIAFQSVVK